MSEPATVFLQLSLAIRAALAGLPEVQGRVYMDRDVSLPVEQLPAVVLELGDDDSSELDDATLQVRVQLQVRILVNSLDATAALEPIERAVHRRLVASSELQETLTGPLKRVMGTRRILRETEGHPVMRRLTYEARVLADPATLAPLS